MNQFAALLRETLRRPGRALKLLDAETRRAFFAKRRLESFVCAAWAHSAKPTLLNTFLYGLLFRPKVILLDDITHNDSMRQAWAILQAIYPQRSVDCATVVPAIRRREGFGLILLNKTRSSMFAKR